MPRAFAEQFAGAVRQHLVGVHVVRRAGACLIGVHDELIAKTTGENLVCRRHDGVRDDSVEASEIAVGFRGRFLDQDRGGDEIEWSAEIADAEIFDGACRLHSVVGVGRDIQLPQRVALGAERHRSIILGRYWVRLKPDTTH